MKECSKRSKPPPEGSICAREPKTCFFGTQMCSDDFPHPTTQCACSGGIPVGRWSCTQYICPKSVPGLSESVAGLASPAQESSVIAPKSSARLSGNFARLSSPEQGSSASVTLSRVDRAIRKHIVNNPKQAASFVRLAFHDCVPNGPDGGGCDGCINLANPSNNGLHEVVTVLARITKMFETEEVTRADIWAYSAMVASDATQSEIIFTDNFKIGRQTCESRGTCTTFDPTLCSSHGPDDITMFPTADFSVHETLDFFMEHFNMNARQTVALIGAHTIGTANRADSGYDGPNGWVVNNTHLDNDYFVQLVTSDFVKVEVNNADLRDIPDETQWVRHVADANGEEKAFLMLNSDIALVRDVTLLTKGQANCTFNAPLEVKCPLATKTLGFVETYAEDNLLWLNDFKEAMTIMIEKTPY